MDRKLIGALLVFLTCCGCRACDCSCDHLPPVLDGPYSPGSMRSGSALGTYHSAPMIEGEAITPLPAEE